MAEVSKEALSQRTADYARNHAIPIEWAEKGVGKDHVLRWLRRMEKRNAYGVYFIFKSMELQHRPDSRLEAAYHRADTAIQRVVDLLAAA